MSDGEGPPPQTVENPGDSCDYQASTIGTLTKHKQSIHKAKKYPCDLCHYQATQKGDLT